MDHNSKAAKMPSGDREEHFKGVDFNKPLDDDDRAAQELEKELLAQKQAKQAQKEKKKHKKEKKKKKEKKEKKDNNTKKPEDSSSESGDNAGESEWVDARTLQPPAPTPPASRPAMEADASMTPPVPKAQREDWMSAPEGGLFGSLNRRKLEADKDKEEQQPKEDPDKPKIHSRELNPFLTGKAGEDYKSPDLKTVGDGGTSWRSRVAQRMKEANAAKGGNTGSPSSTLQDREEDRNYLRDAPADSSLRKLDEISRERERDRDSRSTSHRDRERDRERDRDRDRDSSSKYALIGERYKMRKPQEEEEREKAEEDRKAQEKEAETSKKPSTPAVAVVAVSTTPAVPSPAPLPSDIDADLATYLKTLGANHLMAFAVRSRLRGDLSLYEQTAQWISHCQKQPDVIVVQNFDAFGRPLATPSQMAAAQMAKDDGEDPQRRKKLKGEHENMSVREMVERERMETTRDFAHSMAENVLRLAHTADDDDMGENQIFDGKRRKKQSDNRQVRSRAINEHQKQVNALEQCWFCIDNPKADKRLMIALGEYTYLALPKRGMLMQGHCLILPNTHVVAMTLADEEIMAEVQNFKRSLTAMFHARKQEPIFLETVTNLKKNRHTFIEVIPLPQDLAAQASGYFKKAIMESEEEWAQNKKLIDTTGKPIRRCVPKEFPYFHVEIGYNSVSGNNLNQAAGPNRGLNTGFAHVIEDARDFPYYFGKEVIGGMLELSPDRWRKPQDESPHVLQESLKAFLQSFAPFDWTTQLEGGEF